MNKYTRIKVLGEGGYGKAILAKRRSDNRQFVIKEVNLAKMNSKEKEESFKEARILRALQHPNIVTYTDSFQEANRFYIVMEYADGGDLAQKIEKQRGARFTEEQIFHDFLQIALAIKYIHDRKILHRDLKTQNVFLTRSGRVKLGDFGIAKPLDNTAQLCRTQIGTPYYLSPEICEGRSYNAKTDIWSLGCILYELITLKHPFIGRDMNVLMNNIIHSKFSPIPTSYSQNLRDLVSKMLSKDPRTRPNINQILRYPFIRDRLSAFLDATLAQDFDHTILHGRAPLQAPTIREMPKISNENQNPNQNQKKPQVLEKIPENPKKFDKKPGSRAQPLRPASRDHPPNVDPRYPRGSPLKQRAGTPEDEKLIAKQKEFAEKARLQREKEKNEKELKEKQLQRERELKEQREKALKEQKERELKEKRDKEQKELERKKEIAKLKEYAKQREIEKQKQIEFEKQKQKEMERQKEIERLQKIAEQKEIEEQKRRQKEIERENELQRQKEIEERKKKEMEKQKEMERLKEIDRLKKINLNNVDEPPKVAEPVIHSQQNLEKNELRDSLLDLSTDDVLPWLHSGPAHLHVDLDYTMREDNFAPKKSIVLARYDSDSENPDSETPENNENTQKNVNNENDEAHENAENNDANDAETTQRIVDVFREAIAIEDSGENEEEEDEDVLLKSGNFGEIKRRMEGLKKQLDGVFGSEKVTKMKGAFTVDETDEFDGVEAQFIVMLDQLMRYEELFRK